MLKESSNKGVKQDLDSVLHVAFRGVHCYTISFSEKSWDTGTLCCL